MFVLSSDLAFNHDTAPKRASNATPGASEVLALQWLAAESAAKFLVDAELRLLWANPVACAWLEERDCVTLKCEQLWLPNSQAELKHLLTNAEEANQGFCAPIEGSSAHVILCAKRVGAVGQPRFGLTGRRTDDIRNSQIFGIAEIFGLTHKEMDVLRLMLAGLTAADIAAQHGNSIETIRTHIRRLYAKLDVNSREGLFTAVRPFLIET